MASWKPNALRPQMLSTPVDNIYLIGRGRTVPRSHNPKKLGSRGFSLLVAADDSVPVALPGPVACLIRIRSKFVNHPVLHRTGCPMEDDCEAYISTKQPAPCQEARFPSPHEHPRRARRAQEPSRQGARSSLSLIFRIRERHGFERLARDGTRIRRSSLWCTCCPDPDSGGTSVAFALSRALGPAVTRNQLRRRLRSLLREADQRDPLPPVLMLLGARSSAIELTFDQLRSELDLLIQQVRRTCSP